MLAVRSSTFIPKINSFMGVDEEAFNAFAASITHIGRILLWLPSSSLMHGHPIIVKAHIIRAAFFPHRLVPSYDKHEPLPFIYPIVQANRWLLLVCSLEEDLDWIGLDCWSRRSSCLDREWWSSRIMKHCDGLRSLDYRAPRLIRSVYSFRI